MTQRASVALAVALVLAAGCHAPKPRAPRSTPTGAPMRLGWVL